MLDLPLRAIILPAADIKTGAKGATFSAKKNHAHIQALLQAPKIILQRKDHRLVHRVELVRAVERQYLNGTALFDVDRAGHLG